MLVVDDGSPDGTGEIVEEIMRDEPARPPAPAAEEDGAGHGVLAGFRWALERTYDFVFEMDADFSHDPAHLPEFLERDRERRTSCSARATGTAR